MKKLIERFKNLRKKKAIKNFVETHEDWLGGEARVFFPKDDDEKNSKQRKRKR
jgi:hypothetical protein